MKKVLVALFAVSMLVTGCTQVSLPGENQTPTNTTEERPTYASGNLNDTNSAGVSYGLTYQNGTTTYNVSSTTPTPAWTYDSEAELNGDLLTIRLNATEADGVAPQVISSASTTGMIDGNQPSSILITVENNPLVNGSYQGSIVWSESDITQSS